MESEELGEVLEAVDYYLTGRHTNSGLTGRNDLWGFSGIKGEGESRRNREVAKASLQVLSTRVEEECDSPQRPS